MPKQLMRISTSSLITQPETGMDFQIVESSNQLYAVLGDGHAIPLIENPDYFSIDDLLGKKIDNVDNETKPLSLDNPQSFNNRALALAAFTNAKVSPKYNGSSGAFPLIYSHKLTVDTIFYRLINNIKDSRFNVSTTELSSGTYLTTELDKIYTNTGFATVGRYALPIPLPASQSIQYELPKGTTIEIGTIAPMFGQAGGGVEVRIPSTTKVKLIGSHKLPEY